MAEPHNDNQLGNTLERWVSSTHAFTVDEIRAIAAAKSDRPPRASAGFALATVAFVVVASIVGWAGTRSESSSSGFVPAVESPETSAPGWIPRLLPVVSGCDVPTGVQGPSDDVEPALSNVIALGSIPAADVVAVNASMPGLGSAGIALALDSAESLSAEGEREILDASGTTPAVVVQRCASAAAATAAATAIRSSLAAVSITENTGGVSVSVDSLRGLVVLAGSSSITSDLVVASGVDPSIVETVDAPVIFNGGSGY